MDVPKDVLRILGANEQVQLYVKQKIYHPTITVDSVILTNQRIILRDPRAMGLKKDYTDYSYSDIANVILDKGILRSTIRCVLRFNGDNLKLEDLPNDEAQKAYGIIRENLTRFQGYMTGGGGGFPNLGAYQQMAYQQQQMQQQQTTATSQATLTCAKCGQKNPQGTNFCKSCGQKISG